MARTLQNVRMTRDAGVGCDDSKRTDGEAPQGAPYSTREALQTSIHKIPGSKPTVKKNYLHVKHFCDIVMMMKSNTNLVFICRRTRRITRVFAPQRTCIAWQPKTRILR
jgi:hypothetical protein